MNLISCLQSLLSTLELFTVELGKLLWTAMDFKGGSGGVCWGLGRDEYVSSLVSKRLG
jgi:hypothetical protein